jgi:hypothetical protein
MGPVLSMREVVTVFIGEGGRGGGREGRREVYIFFHIKRVSITTRRAR